VAHNGESIIMIGIAWLITHIMVDVTAFDQTGKTYILNEMKRFNGNIAPVLVIENNGDITSYVPNKTLDALIPATVDEGMKRKTEGVGMWYKEKVLTQRSVSLSITDKINLCDLIEKNVLDGLPLGVVDTARLAVLRARR